MTFLEQLLHQHPELRGACADASTTLGELYDEERPHVERAVHKRLWEFTAGRHCARAALQALGCSAVALPRMPSGKALWPAGYVGSITHTGREHDAFALAVAASDADVRALGVDAERLRPFKADLWRRVLTPTELQALEEVPDSAAQSLLALATFCAKEAAYKCQASLSDQFMGFEDFQVQWDSLPCSVKHGWFSARFMRDVAPHFLRGAELVGNYLVGDDLVLTLVVLKQTHV